jgi:hypothetical protein
MATQEYPSEPLWWAAYEADVAERYARAGLTFPDNPAAFRWFSRTGFDIGAGMTAEQSKAKHLRELEQVLGLTPNPNPPAPGDPSVVRGRLRVNGPRFVDDAGPWRWKLVTAFGAFQRFCAGEYIADYRDWTTAVGGNGWRVLGGFGANPFRPEFDYRKTSGYFDRLDQFCALTRDWGLRLEFVAVCDSIPLKEDDQRGHLNRCADVLARYDHTLLQLANEPWKNGLDPLRFDIRRDGLLVSRGAHQTDNQQATPYVPSLGYTTYHPPRSADWPRKVGKDCREIRGGYDGFPGTGDVVISDEPMGAAEEMKPGSRSNNPREFFCAGVAGALFTPGVTGHGDSSTMQRAQVPGPIETACIRELFRGLDLVPLDAPTWTYARYGNANPGVPMPVQPPSTGEDGRMHAMLGERAGVVCSYDDFDTDWRAEGRNGWRVVEQHGPLVLVER